MKRNRILIASLLAGVALSATSVSFSFAWYASATRLRVETIEVAADPERSLTISTAADGEYKPALVQEDLKRVGLFTPVTSCYDSTWVGIEDQPHFYDMSHVWSTFHEPKLFDAPNDGYFCQDVYLMCDTNAYVGIDFDATSVHSDEAANAAYARQLHENSPELDEETYLDRLNKAYLCGRIGLYVDGAYTIIDPNYNEETVYYGGALDNNNDGDYDIYVAPDGTLHEVCYGELLQGHDRDELTYELVTESRGPAGEGDAFDAVHRQGTYALDFEASKSLFRSEPRIGQKELDSQLPMPEYYFEMQAYVPKKVNVSFYLEGWDRDSINGAMGATLNLQLSFRIIRER